MTLTREPDTMTPDERRQEVAAILAQALLRRLRAGGQQCSKEAGIELDLPAETRLTVACATVVSHAVAHLPPSMGTLQESVSALAARSLRRRCCHPAGLRT